MYHMPLSHFQGHLDLIAAGGHEVLDYPRLRAALEQDCVGSWGPGGVLICFDDGWNGALAIAAEELDRRGLPGFFFVTTGLLGRPLFADAASLRRLDPGNHTVGSHGVTHRMMSSLSDREIRAELEDSRKALEDLLGRGVRCVSIPGGSVDGRVRRIAQDVGYTYIFTSTVAVNPTRRRRRDIGRIGISRSTTARDLQRWLSFDLRRERLRKGILGVPKRMLGMRGYSRLRRRLLGEGPDDGHFFEP